MKAIKNGQYVETTRIAWYLHNKLHREDGPAVEYYSPERKGQKDWYLNGLHHRIDGPACINKTGQKKWWIEGKELSEKEFNQWLDKKNLHEKLEKNLSAKPLQKRIKI